jgi:hypothetical protein
MSITIRRRLHRLFVPVILRGWPLARLWYRLWGLRLKGEPEPPRVCRRLQTLRGWSHGNEEDLTEIFT